MKKTTITLSMAALMSGLIFSHCSSKSEKVEQAQTKVLEAHQDLEKAQNAYTEEYLKYKQETSEKIAENEKTLAEFKIRVDHQKKEAKAEYNDKINALEKKNSDLKLKLDDFKADSKEKWETFKAEFNHDMNELGDAFKDFTVKNNK